MIKYKYSKLYWFFKDFEWMKVYFSPFKPIIPKLYIGRVAIGTPYFYPRRWVKATPQRAIEASLKELANIDNFNKRNQEYKRRVKSFDEVYNEKMKCQYAVPKRIGFDFVGLGWKTKWEDDDYRFEWNPVWSFVFFKWQIALKFKPENDFYYWSCWLYYSRNTKGTAKERLEQAKKEFPCVWKKSDGEKVNYWNLILKKKWL